MVSAGAPTFEGNRVFITATTYSGAIGGLAAADGFCQSSAAAAGLPGTYRAWLSDGTTSASERVTDAGPWYSTRHERVFAAKADLAGSPAALIADETGATPSAPSAAWSGSDTAGLTSSATCDGWTNASGELAASTGSGLAYDPSWGGGDVSAACNAKASLICFQQ